MTDQSMLNELRSILAEEKKIDPTIADRLTLAALVTVIETLSEHKKEREERFSKMDLEIAKINANPSIRVGRVMQRHPKLFWIISVLVIAVILIPHINEVWQLIAVFVNLYAGVDVL